MSIGGAAASNALVLLNSANLNLPHSSSLREVSDALTVLNEAIRSHDPARPMRVFPKVVLYTSSIQRIKDFNLYFNRNVEEAKVFDEQEWKEEMSFYGIWGDAVVTATQKMTLIMMGTFQNIVFSHSFYAKVYGDHSAFAIEQHRRRGAEWHEFVFLLNQRKVYIYDPSYTKAEEPLGNKRRRFADIPMIGKKTNEMIRALKDRKVSVAEYYYGGGGNEDGCCREMCLRWIDGWARAQITGSKSPDLEGWERMNT